MSDHKLKEYPVWSNYIYFITSAYIAGVGARCRKIEFVLYSIIILLSGIFSIVYHKHTPSYTGSRETWDDKNFKIWSCLDQGFAVLVLVVSILFFIWRVYVVRSIVPFLKSHDLWLSILFIILSSVFFVLGDEHHKRALECNKHRCFDLQLDSYDIFHSNWHIFTSIGLIFWTKVLLVSY